MIVFKKYFQVVRTFLPTILIYTIIFVGIALLTSQNPQTNQDYQAYQCEVAIINHDDDTKFIQSFRSFIKDHATINDNLKEDQLYDALFFRQVDYIMIIPKNFTTDFFNHKDVHIKTMEVPTSSSAIYSKNLMNKYLNTAKLYTQSQMPFAKMLESIEKDLNIQSDIEMVSHIQSHSMDKACTFYNFANYILLALIVDIVSMVMISFREENIQNRTLVSALSRSSYYCQLLLANALTTIGIWLIYVVASLVLYRDVMFSQQGLLMIINSFVFIGVVFTFAFLLTVLTKKRKLVNGIATVVSLGSSFIAGAFVPQAYLSQAVLNIAKVTPSYWYISNNNQIASLSSLTLANLMPIFINMAILFGFILILFILIQGISYYQMKRQ